MELNDRIKKIEKSRDDASLFAKCLRYTITIGVIIICFAIFSIDLFSTNKDTFAFTNYGFAVMAAYSSICFSWARNVENKELSRKINMLGSTSIYGGIIFLFGSIFKYILTTKSVNGAVRVLSFNVSTILWVICFLCLGLAIVHFAFTSINLLKLATDFRKQVYDDVIEIAKSKAEEINEAQTRLDEKEKELNDLIADLKAKANV